MKRPNEMRAPDLCKNPSGVEAAMAAQRKREKRLRMRQVSRNTWILVPKKKDNEKYARKYAEEKLGIRPVNTEICR